MTIVAHTLGYELRCAAPTTSDMGYARDLGHCGVRLLTDSTQEIPSGVMIALREENLHTVLFEEMVDPTTNRTKIGAMDINSYSYQVARAYMIRLERDDLESPATVAALALKAHMTHHQFRNRYESVVKGHQGNR